ncbi:MULTISPECIES: SDR family NAD(P)-dependent oxidoreductase [Alteromonas]|uniref:Short-chain dehydrogenase n=1 Tax=Alteromonas macleodii TaxID=28108 RepID=A0A6T9Y0U2_ALTMA|nr:MULTISPECIES: SDR family NAD(P)-dependent oxidoreductase [Alteromonas]MCZ8529614.1 SDR family NAD(P)-dependent oxidoreductase [Alteromonas sp. PRIM-21]CAB9494652.1 Short-chain dehydrogenase [Alteromonas macleodii]
MKSILITGATSGIGKALAIKCADNGYNVIACGRNQDALDELSKHSNISACQFDVSDVEDTKRALANVKFDIAVLNAGTCEYVDLEDFEPDMFRRVFEPNFFGVVHCVDALLPRLKDGDKLVIVDSMARLLPFTRTQAYGSSKAALHYFTKSLEVDLHHRGVKVQAVSPGFVETPLTDKNDFEMPMKISAEEAAEAMLKGIESNKQTVFFPRFFGFILRFMHILPTPIQKRLSVAMRKKQ